MSTVKLKSLTPGQTYSFRYPNFTDGTDYRRVLVEAMTSRDGRQMIEGVDLDNGNDAKWYLDRMERVEPITVALIPKRAYRCKWGRREFALMVWSCYPTEDGSQRTKPDRARGFPQWRLQQMVTLATRLKSGQSVSHSGQRPSVSHHQRSHFKARGMESHGHEALYPLCFCTASDRRRSFTATAKGGGYFFRRL